MSQVTDRQGGPRPRYCAFDAYIVDMVGGLLWRDGAAVHLRPKDVEILIALIEHRDRVVEKSEIFERVWPGVIVEENNIARRISELRRVLGEDAGQRSFVATFPSRGYRFVADVHELEELPWTAGNTGRADATGHPPRVAGMWKRPLQVGVVYWIGAAALFAGIGGSAPAPAPGPAVPRQFSFGADLQHQPAWSPDGSLIAYASGSGGNSDIWVQRAPGTDPQRLTVSPANDWQPTWSPDGQWVAFRSERDGGGIWAVRKDGEREHPIINRGLSPQWSPDGKWILFSAGNGRSTAAWPYVVSPAGPPARPVLVDLLAGSGNKYAAWHPDGRLSVWFRDSDGQWRFATGPVSGGRVIESRISPDVEAGLARAGIRLRGLAFPFSRLERFAWAPSGQYLYFEALTEGARSIWRISVDKETLEWTKGPDAITSGIGNHAEISISPDGHMLAFTAQASRTRIWAFPLDGSSGRAAGAGTPVTPGRDSEVYTRTTADGAILIYRSVQGSRNEFKVRRAAAPDDDRTLVGGIDRNGLQLAPDGSRVVYTRFGASGPAYLTESSLVTLPLDGGAERTVFASPRVRFAPTDWSADGELLLGHCIVAGTQSDSICTLPARPDRVPESALRTVISPRAPGSRLASATFSPNREWIAFTERSRTSAGASSVVYVTSALGGPWIRVAEGESFNDRPRWAPDGRTVYFLSNRGGCMNVWGQAFDPASGRAPGSPFPVTSFHDPQLSIPESVEAGIAVTSTHVLVPLTERTAAVWVLPASDRRDHLLPASE
jgi:Tol biopolymer transport system component/DNA-binding winged helix-turn-helix (wHTH) protein